jgi:hypothetical protein
MAIPLRRPSPGASCDRPERRRGGSPSDPGRPGSTPLLLGLAPGGVFRAAAVAGGAVRSYRTVSPLPSARHAGEGGGILSVALSLGSPPPGVTRHRTSVEPGLSSLRSRQRAAIRPSGDQGFGRPPPLCQTPGAGAALREPAYPDRGREVALDGAGEQRIDEFGGITRRRIDPGWAGHVG